MNFFQAIWEWIASIFTKKEKYEREFFCGNFLIGYPGKFSLHFLSSNMNDAQRKEMIQKHKDFGCNFFKYNTLNSDANCYITPYKSGFGGNFNEDWFKMAEDFTDQLIDSDMEVCSAITMDGCSWNNPNNYAEHCRMIDRLAESFKNRWRLVSVGHEVSEYWSASYAEKIGAKCKQAFPNSMIGLHSQEYNIFIASPSLEFLMYEFGWHPNSGSQHSAEEVWDTANKVVVACGGKKIIFDEYNTDVYSNLAMSQGLSCASQDTYRVIGVNNSFPSGSDFVKFIRNLPAGMTAKRSGSLVIITGCDKTAQIDLKNRTYEMM